MSETIRKASESDFQNLHVLTKSLGYTVDLGRFTTQLQQLLKDNDHQIYVAVADGKLVGYIHCMLATRLTSLPFVEIVALVVSPDNQNKGIGTKLVSKVSEWAKKMECTKLRVRCNTKRENAHQFYNNLGFTSSKQQLVFGKSL